MTTTIRPAPSAAGTLPQDLHSWEVRTGPDDERVGTVENVLLDEDGVTRFLEVALADDDRHVLLPGGHARTDFDDEVVRVPGLTPAAFRDVPAYEGDDSLDPDYERRLGDAYDRGYDADAFYRSPDYAAPWTGRPKARAEGAEAPARVDTLDDVDVADYEDDPRGWTVIGHDGTDLGTVEHLVGDTTSMQVHYVTVRLDPELVGDERRILIPIGHVALETDVERVRIDGLSRARVADFPVWTGGTIQRAHERAIGEFIARGYSGERRFLHPRYRTDGLARPDA